MATELGMDAVIVRELASQMDRIVHQLTGVASTANHLVGTFASHWDGGDVEALAHAWQYRHRAQVMALAGEIHALAQTARAEAAAQEHASGPRAADSSSAKVDSHGNYALSVAESIGALSIFSGGLTRVNNMLGFPDLVRRWDTILRQKGFGPAGVNTEKRLARFWRASSGVFERGVPHRLTEPIADFGKRFATVGRGLGILGLGVTLGEKGSKLVADASSGDWNASAHDVLGGTAAVLKSSKSPVTYLSGFLIDEYTDVYDQAVKIDWSEPIPALTPSNLVHVYAPSFGEALQEVPGHIWKWAT